MHKVREFPGFRSRTSESLRGTDVGWPAEGSTERSRTRLIYSHRLNARSDQINRKSKETTVLRTTKIFFQRRFQTKNVFKHFREFKFLYFFKFCLMRNNILKARHLILYFVGSWLKALFTVTAFVILRKSRL